jgi:hypothetical protein
VVANRNSKQHNKTVCRGKGPGALKKYIVQRHEDVWVSGGAVPLLCVSMRDEGVWTMPRLWPLPPLGNDSWFALNWTFVEYVKRYWCFAKEKKYKKSNPYALEFEPMSWLLYLPHMELSLVTKSK